MALKLRCKLSSKLIKTGAFYPTRKSRSELEIALLMKSRSFKLTGMGQHLVAISRVVLWTTKNLNSENQKARSAMPSRGRLQLTRQRSSNKWYVVTKVEAPSKPLPDLITQLKPVQPVLMHAQVKQHLKTQFATQEAWFPAFALLRKFYLSKTPIKLTCKILCTQWWARLGGRPLSIARLSMRCQSPKHMLANSRALKMMRSRPIKPRLSIAWKIKNKRNAL